MDLQEHLRCEVDVMTPAMLKSRVRARILRAALPL
jgi:predicted nucleotidyltransferase